MLLERSERPVKNNQLPNISVRVEVETCKLHYSFTLPRRLSKKNIKLRF